MPMREFPLVFVIRFRGGRRRVMSCRCDRMHKTPAYSLCCVQCDNDIRMLIKISVANIGCVDSRFRRVLPYSRLHHASTTRVSQFEMCSTAMRN
jgi:hypothetical protein